MPSLCTLHSAFCTLLYAFRLRRIRVSGDCLVLGPLLLILLLMIANGFFVAAEIAIIAARKGRLEQLAEEGSRGAKLALSWPPIRIAICPRCNSASRSLNTFVAVFGGEELVKPLADVIAQSPDSILSPTTPIPFRWSFWSSASRFYRCCWANWCPSNWHCGRPKRSPALSRRC